MISKKYAENQNFPGSSFQRREDEVSVRVHVTPYFKMNCFSAFRFIANKNRQRSCNIDWFGSRFSHFYPCCPATEKTDFLGGHCFRSHHSPPSHRTTKKKQKVLSFALLDLIVPCHEEWICWSVSILSAHSSWIGVFDEIAAKNGRHLDEISCSVCVCVGEFPSPHLAQRWETSSHFKKYSAYHVNTDGERHWILWSTWCESERRYQWNQKSLQKGVLVKL